MDMGDSAGDGPPSGGGGGGGALQDSNNNHACIAKLGGVTTLVLRMYTDDQGVDTFGLPEGVSPSSKNNADDTSKAIWGKKFYSVVREASTSAANDADLTTEVPPDQDVSKFIRMHTYGYQLFWSSEFQHKMIPSSCLFSLHPRCLPLYSYFCVLVLTAWHWACKIACRNYICKMVQRVYKTRRRIDRGNGTWVWGELGSFEDFLNYFRSAHFMKAFNQSKDSRHGVCRFVVTIKKAITDGDWVLDAFKKFLALRDGRPAKACFRLGGSLMMSLNEFKTCSFYRAAKKAMDDTCKQIDNAARSSSRHWFSSRGKYKMSEGATAHPTETVSWDDDLGRTNKDGSLKQQTAFIVSMTPEQPRPPTMLPTNELQMAFNNHLYHAVQLAAILNMNNHQIFARITQAVSGKIHYLLFDVSSCL